MVNYLVEAGRDNPRIFERARVRIRVHQLQRTSTSDSADAGLAHFPLAIPLDSRVDLVHRARNPLLWVKLARM